MQLDAHWQALYDNITAGLAADGLSAVPVLAIHSTYTQTADEVVEPPYVVYTTETLRPTGTFEGGPNKVVMDGWRITVRAVDLQEMLDIITALTDKFELEDIAATTDGYYTTAVTLLGHQTLWEVDSKLHAGHLRIAWERSK